MSNLQSVNPINDGIDHTIGVRFKSNPQTWYIYLDGNLIDYAMDINTYDQKDPTGSVFILKKEVINSWPTGTGTGNTAADGSGHEISCIKFSTDPLEFDDLIKGVKKELT